MKKFIETPLFFALLGVLFFLPFLGGVHLFDWDEINFAEIAREMVVTGNYFETYINYETFTEKPPMFMWLQAAAMTVFGVGDYAARFPNALLGVIALPVLFYIGKRLHHARFGFYWALAWFGSILPHLYYKSGIIDPVFNFFIFLGLFFIIRYTWVKNEVNTATDNRKIWVYLGLAGLFTGLAILVKGPVAYLIISLTLGVYWIQKRFKWYISVPHFLFYTMVALGVVLIWASINYLQNGPKFIVEFTIRQWTMLTTKDAGHGGFFGYHVVVLLFGCFPASIFAIQSMIKKVHGDSRQQSDFKVWMTILFWVILILFSIVSTKIVHYSSMAYYPITYLAALSLYNIDLKKWRITASMKTALWVIGGLAVALTIALPIAGINIDVLKPLFSKDPFAVENLQAQINWTGFESFAGIFLIVVLIFFMGMKRRQYQIRFAILFVGVAFWVFLTLVFDIGKIESISQRAAIEFWEDRQGEDCYVTTFDYKSYAHLYYARINPPTNSEEFNGNANQPYLLHGDVDKPVYISCKVTSKHKLEADVKDAEFLYSKNGFYFYKRSAKNSN